MGEKIKHSISSYWLEFMQVVFGFIITGIIAYAGYAIVSGIDQNTSAVKSLERAFVDSNTVINSRIAGIDSKIEIGREKSISAYKELKSHIYRNTERIEKLEDVD